MSAALLTLAIAYQCSSAIKVVIDFGSLDYEDQPLDLLGIIIVHFNRTTDVFDLQLQQLLLMHNCFLLNNCNGFHSYLILYLLT